MKSTKSIVFTAFFITFLGLPLTASDREWGVNFWAHDYYTEQAVFVDVTRMMSYGPNSPMPDPATGQGLPVDPERRVFSQLNGYPAGTYKLRFDGSGRIEFGGRAELVTESVRKRNGHTYADVKIGEGDGMVEMYFHHKHPEKAPIRNVRLICPGYDADTKKLFRDEAWKRLRPFTTLRFMDWNWTNNSVAGDWSERRPRDWFFQTVGFGKQRARGGMAYELMIEICNRGKKNMWLCIPHTADKHYIEQLARLLHKQLDPGLTLYVELSNELWNFSQGPELAREVIGEDWSRGDDPSLYKGAVAPRLHTVSRIFRRVFSDRRKKLNVVLAGQIGNPWHIKQAYEGWKEHGVDPEEVIDSIAVAPYLHAGAKRSSVDQLIKDMRKYARGKMVKRLRAHARLANKEGLDLLAYEGGQHVFHHNVSDEELVRKVQKDPRMRELYHILSKEWEQAGGDLFVHYTYAGYPWGLLPDGSAMGSVKYDAVMDLLLPDGDATLNGEVNFADVEVLEKNVNTSGRWWMQGDFNADRRVNGSDLQLLQENVEDLTPDQKARIKKLVRD